jgi:hypothetical protein
VCKTASTDLPHCGTYKAREHGRLQELYIKKLEMNNSITPNYLVTSSIEATNPQAPIESNPQKMKSHRSWLP